MTTTHVNMFGTAEYGPSGNCGDLKVSKLLFDEAASGASSLDVALITTARHQMQA